MTRVPFTADEIAVVMRRYPHEPTAAIARDMGRTVSSVYQLAHRRGLRKTAQYLASGAAGRFDGRNPKSIAHRFHRGHTPANKGLRRPGWGPGRMKETQFKPGVRAGAAAKNWCPVGTIRPDAEGYLRIKVREGQRGEATGFGNTRIWPLLQRHVWAEVHGPIPPRHAIVFRDGDRRNCAIDNLALVSRSELLRRNSIHRLPKPIADAIQLLGALHRQISKRTDHAKEDDHQRPPRPPVRDAGGAQGRRAANGHRTSSGRR